MTDLRDRISLLRQACTGAAEIRYFYPFSDLLSLLTENEIHAALEQIPEIHSSSRDLRRFSSVIREDYLRIFATLVMTRDEKYITKFLYRRETDLKLPFVGSELDFLTAAVRDGFLERQFQFHAVVLEYGAIHRKLRPEEILPFLSSTRKGEGGFGTVWTVKVHPTSHALHSRRTNMATGHERVSQV
jgi:hypothetical protein